YVKDFQFYKLIFFLKQIKTCIGEFESSQRTFISDLEEYITELSSIADEVDNFHRKAVITNVVGSSVGIAGGVATIAGLLSLFTFGASLAITGISVGAAAVGAVTSATASIVDNAHIKKQCEKVEVIIKKANEGEEKMQDILSKIYGLIGEIKSLLGLKDEDLGSLGGRGLYTVAQMIHLTKLSAAAAEGVKLAAHCICFAEAVSGVFAVLFLGVDIGFVVKGAKELKDGAKTKEAEKIREVVKELEGARLMMHSKAEEFKNCKIVLQF
uniref:Apolipoprotein L3 n=2 Tax=Leptobrachium leishanense TaxID=445787 RepID=A0A8C5Q7K2_9ANUR